MSDDGTHDEGWQPRDRPRPPARVPAPTVHRPRPGTPRVGTRAHARATAAKATTIPLGIISDATAPEVGAGPPVPPEGFRRARHGGNEASRWAPLVLVGAAVLVVVALALATTMLRSPAPQAEVTARPPSTAPAGPQSPAAAPSVPSATAPTIPTASPARATTAAAAPAARTTAPPLGASPAPMASPPDAAAAALAANTAAISALDRTVAADLSRLPRAGRIVVYLMTRYDGINDPYVATASGSHTWRATDILAEHQRLKRAFPALALKAGTVAGMRAYTSVLDGNFASAKAALAWCTKTYPQYSGDALRSRCYVPA